MILRTVPPSARRLTAALLVVAVTVSCSRVGQPPAAAPTIPPGKTFLTVVADPSRVSRPAGRVCSTDDPVVVSCDLVPLFPPALSLCPGPTTTDHATTSSSLPCRLPGVEQRRFGWVLSRGPAPGGTATLRVFLGGDDTVRQVLEARDAGSPWAEAAVCPRDFTGDSLTDLVVVFRTRDRPDVVDVEAVDLTRLPLTVLVLPPRSSPPDQGQGCSTPAVVGLGYDADQHELTVGSEAAYPASAVPSG